MFGIYFIVAASAIGAVVVLMLGTRLSHQAPTVTEKPEPAKLRKVA